MSSSEPPVRVASDLYDRIAETYERAVETFFLDIEASGFVAPGARNDSGLWRPQGQLPVHIFDSKAANDAAKVCVFGAYIYVLLHSRSFTEFERQKLANTVQPLTLILNGREIVETHCLFDGRTGWTCFRASVPSGLSGPMWSIEIDHDGRLLFSGYTSEDADATNYRATVWVVTPAGKIGGGVTGANCDVPVKLRVGDQTFWTITNPPLEPGRPRRFEFDLKSACAEGNLVKVSVHNPASGAEAVCSPVGVFVSQGEHFLIANPRIADGRCNAVLMSGTENRRRILAVGDATRPTIEVICRVNGGDAADAWFDGGHNTFDLDIERLKMGDLVILDEAGKIIGALPTFEQIASLSGNAFK